MQQRETLLVAMELKERPLLRLKFARVSRPYLLLKRDQNELVAVFPLCEKENRWAILERLVRLRDLLWAQEPERN
jgi:hypothetical protein